MAYWLLKTEPGSYSYDDLVRDGETVWDGVSNNLALKNLRAMGRGDSVFIYHTGSEKAIVGIARVAREPYPDPRRDDPRLVVVDITPEKRLRTPVPLSAVKSRKDLRSFPLVRLPRLSVMPVTAEERDILLAMGK